MKYPLTFYVKSLPDNYGGLTNGPVIRILEKYREDEGLYQHELFHVKQWFFTLFLHPILYFLIEPYKLWSEVTAYRIQSRYYYEDRLPLFAHFIATYYNLDITESKALEKLNNG